MPREAGEEVAAVQGPGSANGGAGSGSEEPGSHLCPRHLPLA